MKKVTRLQVPGEGQGYTRSGLHYGINVESPKSSPEPEKKISASVPKSRILEVDTERSPTKSKSPDSTSGKAAKQPIPEWASSPSSDIPDKKLESVPEFQIKLKEETP